MGSIPIWKSAELIGLYDSLFAQWNKITSYMHHRGFFKTMEDDCLIWNGPNGRSAVCVKDAYLMLQMESSFQLDNIFPLFSGKLVALQK